MSKKLPEAIANGEVRFSLKNHPGQVFKVNPKDVNHQVMVGSPKGWHYFSTFTTEELFSSIFIKGVQLIEEEAPVNKRIELVKMGYDWMFENGLMLAKTTHNDDQLHDLMRVAATELGEVAAHTLDTVPDLAAEVIYAGMMDRINEMIEEVRSRHEQQCNHLVCKILRTVLPNQFRGHAPEDTQ